MRRVRRTIAAALLVVGSVFPPEALAAEGVRRLELRSASQCPNPETLRAVVSPLLPGWSVDVGKESTASDQAHLVSWDERGLRFDGSLVKKRGSETDCRRLAENWAVTLALLAESPESRFTLEESPAEANDGKPDEGAREETAPRAAPEPTIERTLFLGGAGGVMVPLVADGALRGFGQLDAHAAWGRLGLRLALGATSVERVRTEDGPDGLLVAAAQGWVTVGGTLEVPLSFATLRGTLGPLLALEDVEGSGLERGFRSLAPNVGVDVGVTARFLLRDSWFWFANAEVAFFPRPAALSARNVTTEEAVSLGRLPAVLPRLGVGFGRSFAW